MRGLNRWHNPDPNNIDSDIRDTWQQIGVTYTQTFVSGKTLNFTINASDLTKA